MSDKLSRELESFQSAWRGGYYEGDPLRPLAPSGFGVLNYMSILHATYLRCIKPYVKPDTTALEIGPGRGAWTKALLPAKEVWAMDALSAEHNATYEYLGHPKNLKYFQVCDFRCEMLPENYFDYMFSFGCLCHVSFAGITEYAHNIHSKLKPGATCFWLVADYDKYNEAARRLDDYSVWRHLTPAKVKYAPLRWVLRLFEKFMRRPKQLEMDKNDEPSPCRWYHAGAKRTCRMLEQEGYRIVDEDVGTCFRDPIIQFTKP